MALEENGLDGTYNYGITKLLLSQLGVVEKKEIENKGSVTVVYAPKEAEGI
jgi:hypothetical protein